MQQAKTLPARTDASDAVPPTRLIMEAIARRVTIAATYNAMTLVIAPHVLYTRAGQLYLGGIVVTRNAAPPREAKLGIFKLDGLNDLVIDARPFTPAPALFDPRDERFATTTVFAVEL